MANKKSPAEIGSMARTYTESAIKALVGIYTSQTAAGKDIIKAANSVLAYGWGMPVARIEAKGLNNQTLIINGSDSREIARRLMYAASHDPTGISKPDNIIDIEPNDINDLGDGST